MVTITCESFHLCMIPSIRRLKPCCYATVPVWTPCDTLVERALTASSFGLTPLMLSPSPLKPLTKVENRVSLRPVDLFTGKPYLPSIARPSIFLLICTYPLLQTLYRSVLGVNPTEHNLMDRHILIPAERLIAHLLNQPARHSSRKNPVIEDLNIFTQDVRPGSPHLLKPRFVDAPVHLTKETHISLATVLSLRHRGTHWKGRRYPGRPASPNTGLNEHPLCSTRIWEPYGESGLGWRYPTFGSSRRPYSFTWSKRSLLAHPVFSWFFPTTVRKVCSSLDTVQFVLVMFAN